MESPDMIRLASGMTSDELSTAYKEARASAVRLFDGTKKAVACITFLDSVWGAWGTIVASGGEELTPRFREVEASKNGTIVLIDMAQHKGGDERCALVDPSGKFIIPPFFRIIQVDFDHFVSPDEARVLAWHSASHFAVLNLTGDLLFWLSEDLVEDFGDLYDYVLMPGLHCFPKDEC